MINKNKLLAYVHLARLHKPIGFYLLLWPMLTALLLAANGTPDIKNLVIFCLGMILVRSAGCTINDVADKDFDAHVARTNYRPIATGKISVKAAVVFAVSLFTLAFYLVLQLNKMTIYLSIVAVVTACIYPLFKRFFVAPQFMLSIPYSWCIPMAYAAEQNAISNTAWLLFIANMLWVIAYDTQYAMADRADDLKIGINSSAIWFGKYDNLINCILQLGFLSLMLIIGRLYNLNWCFFVGVLGAALSFVYQYQLTKNRDPMLCFSAFLNNRLVGLSIFLGVLATYYVQGAYL